MLISTLNNHIKYNNAACIDYSDKKYTTLPVTMPACDTISFCGQPLSAKQAAKFLIPAMLGGMGIVQYLPKVLLNKVFDIELTKHEYELYKNYGTSNQEKINAHISGIKQIMQQYPEKLKIIENLLRKSVFNSLGNVKYLSPEKPQLFDKQLEFLNELVKEKEFVNNVDACLVKNSRTKQLYSIQDFDAKKKMIDYIREFNRNYEASDRWKEDKLHSDSWTIGYKQVDIINATNAFNYDLMMEMVKSKTTFIDAICPKDELKAFDIREIGYNITKNNIDYMRKMFRDKNVSREAIVGLSEWIDKQSMNKYKKLNKNSEIPKEYIGDIGAILNDYNSNFVMELIKNPNIPKEDIASLGKYYNENSAPVLNYLVKHIQDNRIKYSRSEVHNIIFKINKENKEYITKLCKNKKIPLEIISNVADIVNSMNFNIITLLGVNAGSYANEVRACVYYVNKKNRRFVETLCVDYQIKAKELASVMDDLYYLDKSPLNRIDFDKKCSILNTHAKYGDLMKECGMDYGNKIKRIADSIQSNYECTQSENLKEFLFKILANNNSETEKFFKTYDFAQFGKNGIPLKYPRKDFVENLEENILSGIKAEDRRTILEHFGIIDNEDYDGLWNNQKIDKAKLISEKGRMASVQVQEELDKFMLRNSAVSKDSNFNKIINGLIQGMPSFVPLIGKVQHGTHDYSVDIHVLKVLQSCLNNPLYEELSDEGKTILKFSALMHDIGKNGKVRDPKHAEKSAEYAESILKTINFPKDVKTRIINIISNHHWFSDYNTNKLTPKNIAVKCRLKEDLLIYQILAKADLENVSSSFHLGVTGTGNNKEYKNYFDKKIKPVKEALEKVQQNANIIFHTKILNNGAKFPKQKIMLENGKTIELKVLNFSDIEKNEELEQFGFPKGTTKDNARFVVHMTESGINFDVVAALVNSNKNNSVWSTSLISAKNNETYGSSPYGFIFDVRQENISEAYYRNTGSGNHKSIADFEDILFDFSDKERKFVKNKLQKELKLHGIWLNDSEYGSLVDYLEKKKHITAIGKDIKIGGKTIKAKTLVKCLEKSRDALFNKNMNEHNEVVVINPKIQGLIAKYDSIDQCNENFLTFAQKYNLPIILIGN